MINQRSTDIANDAAVETLQGAYGAMIAKIVVTYPGVPDPSLSMWE